MRLFQLGVPIGSIDLLLLTHFHSDHVVGIPDLWLTGWLGGKFGSRTTPMQVIGPAGTKHLISHIAEAFSADIAIGIADEQLPVYGSHIDAQEFSTDCVVYSGNAMQISCLRWIMAVFSSRHLAIDLTIWGGAPSYPEIRATVKI